MGTKKDHRVLLTRHWQASERSRRALLKHGHEAVIMPLSEIDRLSSPFPADGFDAITFTSPLAPAMLQKSSFFRSLAPLSVFCVGDFTLHCAIEAGFQRVEGVAKDANSLLPLMTGFSEGRRFLYPCAKERSFDFSRYLFESGKVCVNWEIYSNSLLWPGSEEVKASLQASSAVFLFSCRTAHHFFDIIRTSLVAGSESHVLARHIFICISLDVAKIIPEGLRERAFVSNSCNEASMIDCFNTIRHLA